MSDGHSIPDATLHEVAHYMHARGVSLIVAWQFLKGEPVADCRGWVDVTQMLMGGSMMLPSTTDGSLSTYLPLLEAAKRLGVSAVGAQQFFSGAMVTSAADRARLAQIAVATYVATGNLTMAKWIYSPSGVTHVDDWETPVS
jgi:hypothetical protein